MLSLVNFKHFFYMFFCYLVKNDALTVYLSKSIGDKLIDEVFLIDWEFLGDVLVIKDTFDNFELFPLD